MKKRKKLHVFAVLTLLASVLLIISALNFYIYFPLYSYEGVPFYSPYVKHSRDEVSHEKVPPDYVGLRWRYYYDEQGYQIDSTIYVKEGSIHPLSYWQRLITGEQSPQKICYVKYSGEETRALWDKVQDTLEDEKYAAYSFQFTGDLVLDEELGWRVFLIVDGRDAEFIKEELTKKYGDFVVFDSEKYTRGFFKDAAELCVGWWYEKPSRGYTG